MSKTRTVPYSTPKRRQKHYKQQSRAILRALGASSFLNGSQFSLLLVNADGQHELFSSDLFQRKLTEWFPRAVVAEARELVIAAAGDRDAYVQELSQGPPPAVLAGDVFGPTGTAISLVEGAGGLAVEDDSDDDDEGFPADRLARSTSSRPQANGNAAARSSFQTALRKIPHPLASSAAASPSSPPSPAAGPTRVTRSLSVLTVPPPNAVYDSPYPSPLPSVSSFVPPTHTQVVFTPQSLAAWYTDKFKSLQTKASNTVCKLWIRVIEPKKQTNFPYISGAAGQPSWWPANVRHKEPDHLGKEERIILLATILRACRIPAARLEAATEGETAFIPHAGLAVLREIYKVAREEQKVLAANNHMPFETLSVLLPIGDDEDNPKSSRHKSRRSLNAFSNEELAPRTRTAHAPYPLARSNSVQDIGASPASRGLSRSHSMTGTPSGSGRNRRTKGSDGDGDTASLLGSPLTDNSPQLSSLQPPIHLYSQDGRAQPPPRRASIPHHSSPHPSGEPSSHRSPPDGYGRSQEPSFASPAMIKSRSRLSVQSSQMLPISETAPEGDAYGGRARHLPSHAQEGPPPHRERVQFQVHPGHNLEGYQYPGDYAYPPGQVVYVHQQQQMMQSDHPLQQHHNPHMDPHLFPNASPQTSAPSPIGGFDRSEEEHLARQALHLHELEYLRTQGLRAQELDQYLYEQSAQRQQQQEDAAAASLWDSTTSSVGGVVSPMSEMQLGPAGGGQYYYTPESLDGHGGGGCDDAQIAYVQQYEMERQQQEHYNLGRQDSGVGLGLDQSAGYGDPMAIEAERREENQRRYRAHMYGE